MSVNSKVWACGGGGGDTEGYDCRSPYFLFEQRAILIFVEAVYEESVGRSVSRLDDPIVWARGADSDTQGLGYLGNCCQDSLFEVVMFELLARVKAKRGRN